MLFRYFAREILATSVLMLLALLALFFFFDLIKELDDLGKGSYRLTAMMVYTALMLPSHAYVLLPAAGLMGTLFALARMSEQSEITVLRASGLSLKRLALHVIGAGLVLAVATVLLGEWIAPHTEEAAKGLRLKATRSIVAREFRSGFWVKDDRSFVNIQDVTPDTELLNVRIYEFDRNYRLSAVSRAEKGAYAGPNQWTLLNVELTRFEGQRAVLQRLPQVTWTSVLTPDILSVLKIVPERMSASNLRAYIEHLKENRQRATRYEIAYWSKLLYPFAALSMMVLAIPFALASGRSGGVGVRILFGILIGMGFYNAGKLFSHMGLLNDWPALVAAGMPVVIVGLAAMAGLRLAERR